MILLSVYLFSAILHADSLSSTHQKFSIGSIKYKVSLVITQTRTIYSFPISGLVQMTNTQGEIVTLGDKLHPQWGSVWLFSSDLAARDPKPILSRSLLSSRTPLKMNFQTKMAIDRIASVPGQFAGNLQAVESIRFRFPIIVTTDQRSVVLNLDSNWSAAHDFFGAVQKARDNGS